VVDVSDYLQAAAKGLDTTMRQPPEKMRSLKFNWNSAICHAKSYAVMRMLADLMGPERFLQLLQTLLGRYRGRYLSVGDFQKEAEAAAGRDLGWFFHDWVDTNQTASYAIEAVRGGDTSIQVNIRRTGTARFPVSVELRMADGTRQVKRIDPAPEAQTLTFAAAHDPIRIQIDPNSICPLMTQGKEVWERK
jgi:aminopeptidase N